MKKIFKNGHFIKLIWEQHQELEFLTTIAQ